MIKCAAHKRARVVAVRAIPIVGRGWNSQVSDGGRHMCINQQVAGSRSEYVVGFTARRGPMTGIASIASHWRERVIRKGTCKTVSCMTVATIGKGVGVRGHRGTLAGCESVEIGIADVVVTGIARLHRGIDAVVKYTTQAKARNTVAGFTVDIHHRMALGFSGRAASRIIPVAGIAAEADNQRAVMVGVGFGKISCVMAQFAFPG